MKESNNYNATDFVSYHSGTMPPDEMHALEKAALEDPFLADALEGYAYSKDAKKETDEIRVQLDEKKKQEKRFSLLSFSQNTWWKIAAMLVIICGAGYLFFFINIKKENRQVVKKEVIKKEQDEMISRLNKDTTSEETNIAFEKASPGKDKINVRKLPATPVSKPIRIPTGNVKREEGINRKKEFSEDRLISEKENQLAMKKKAAVAREITTDDSVNKLLFRSSDTAAFIAIPPKEYSKDSVNVLVMNDTKPSLEEVVVVGYGAKKRVRSTGELKGKVSGIQTNANTPYLLEGKEKFDQYIKDNATSFPDSVDILLSFTLDKNRRPNRIKVIESSCKSCEKEITRLLKKGPQWVGEPGDKGTVRIKF